MRASLDPVWAMTRDCRVWSVEKIAASCTQAPVLPAHWCPGLSSHLSAESLEAFPCVCLVPFLCRMDISPGSSAAAEISMIKPSRSTTSKQRLAHESLIWEPLLMSPLRQDRSHFRGFRFPLSTVRATSVGSACNMICPAYEHSVPNSLLGIVDRSPVTPTEG
jgi:hypothetical protein